MATDFAENELDLFRKTLELIVDSETGFASSINILNLVDQLKGKKMRKKEAEQVLQKFVLSKWLIEKEGEFTLHDREFILEMEQFIRETYPDAVKIRNICHSLLIQGQSCETRGVRIHLPCVAKYFQSTSEPCCPPVSTTSTSKEDATPELFLQAVYSGPCHNSFSLQASLSQPLSSPGQPILDRHVGTVHRSTYTQAAYDYPMILALAK